MLTALKDRLAWWWIKRKAVKGGPIVTTAEFGEKFWGTLGLQIKADLEKEHGLAGGSNADSAQGR